MANNNKIPNDKHDVPTPDTVGELVKILQQFPQDAGLEFYRGTETSVNLIDYEFVETPGYRGVLQLHLWA